MKTTLTSVCEQSPVLMENLMVKFLRCNYVAVSLSAGANTFDKHGGSYLVNRFITATLKA